MLQSNELREYKMRLLEEQKRLLKYEPNPSELRDFAKKHIETPRRSQEATSLRQYMRDINHERLENQKTLERLNADKITGNAIPEDTNIRLYENGQSNEKYIEDEFYKYMQPYLTEAEAQEVYKALLASNPNALSELVYNWYTYQPEIDKLKGQYFPRKTFISKLENMLLTATSQKYGTQGTVNANSNPSIEAAPTDEGRMMEIGKAQEDLYQQKQPPDSQPTQEELDASQRKQLLAVVKDEYNLMKVDKGDLELKHVITHELANIANAEVHQTYLRHFYKILDILDNDKLQQIKDLLETKFNFGDAKIKQQVVSSSHTEYRLNRSVEDIHKPFRLIYIEGCEKKRKQILSVKHDEATKKRIMTDFNECMDQPVTKKRDTIKTPSKVTDDAYVLKRLIEMTNVEIYQYYIRLVDFEKEQSNALYPAADASHLKPVAEETDLMKSTVATPLNTSSNTPATTSSKTPIKAQKTRSGKKKSGKGVRFQFDSPTSSGRTLLEHEKPVSNKYYINMNDLDNNVLGLRYLKNRHLTNLKNTYIGGTLKKTVKDAISIGNIDYADYHKLPEAERIILHQFLHMIEKPHLLKEDNVDFNKKLQTLWGEYQAGNNSQLLKKEIKAFILKAIQLNKIPRNIGYNMLLELEL